MAVLSPAQERLWFLHRLHGPQRTYTMAFALKLVGHINHEALESAIRDISLRHEPLSSRFVEKDASVSVERVEPDTLPRLGIQFCPDDAIDLTLHDASKRAFDLAGTPPWEMTLYSCGGELAYLHMTWHHILGDGWSMRPLLEDLATAYNARLRSEAPAWAPLPVDYSDYAAWQRELVDSGSTRKQEEFWRCALSGAPHETRLPYDRPRPPQPQHDGSLFSSTVPAEIHQALNRLCRETRSTMFMVLHTALAVLLSRYGAGDDIVIGTPVAGRSEPELEQLVGLFVNTLALRIDLTNEATLRDVLDNVRVADLEYFSNQDVTFDRIVEMRNPPRISNQHPVFQVMLMLQNAADAHPIFDGLTTDAASIDVGAAKFDLSFAFKERPDGSGIDFDIEYANELFDDDTIVDLADSLLIVLRTLIEHPNSGVNSFPILSPRRTQELIVGFNDTDTDEAEDLIAAILKAAHKFPKRTAVRCENHEVTYEHLILRASNLARQLSRFVSSPGSIVGIFLERESDFVTAALATLGVEATYLPLDPDYPTDRVSYILQDAAPVVLITRSGLVDRVRKAGFDGDILDLDTLDLTAHCDNSTASLWPRAQNVAALPAYVLYTSGSTGNPKGVLVLRGGVSNLVRSVRDRLGLTAGDQFLATATVCFDIAVTELLSPLTVGATTVIATSRLVKDPAVLLSQVRSSGITHMQATPSLWKVLIETDATALKGLTLLSAGEALSASLQRELHNCAGRVLNYYGPTETTIYSTVSLTGPDIGVPIEQTRVYVLNGELKVQPPGVAGELYIAGTGVSAGYIGKSSLTAQRFVADPFSESGLRMYRTGDLAAWKRDGTLRYLGRTDHQVKVRGFRVELGEVEAVIGSEPNIADVAVVADLERQVLDAYIVPAGDHTLVSVSSVRSAAARKLPTYMLPATFSVLDALPKTENGKLDRKALPRPAGSLPGRSFVPPTTPMEKLLCQAFADQLNVQEVSTTDNIFDLGAHSLMLATFSAKISKDGGPSLSVTDFFECPTIAALAARVSGSADVSRSPTIGTWLRQRMSRPECKVSVYFFPHAGGSAGEYISWAAELDAADTWFLQPPGHGDRYRETPLTSMEGVVSSIVSECDFTTPYVFFGHSLGALVAFQVAVALQEQGLRGPELLIASGSRPPGLQVSADPVKGGDDELLADLGVDVDALSADASLREALLSAYVSDVEILRRYSAAGNSKLSCPVLALAGADDRLTREVADQWSRFGSEWLGTRVFPGGHFFFRDNQEEVLECVSSAVLKVAKTVTD